MMQKQIACYFHELNLNPSDFYDSLDNIPTVEDLNREGDDGEWTMLSEILGLSIGQLAAMDWKPIHERLRKYPIIWDIQDYISRTEPIVLGKQHRLIRDPAAKNLAKLCIQMRDRLDSLFVSACRGDLSAGDRNEYNYLVSFFGLADLGCPGAYLYYSNVQRLTAIFPGEQPHELMRYFVNVRQGTPFWPWLSYDFLEDENLMWAYIRRFPETELEIYEFLTEAGAIEPDGSPAGSVSSKYTPLLKRIQQYTDQDYEAQVLRYGEENVLAYSQNAIKDKARHGQMIEGKLRPNGYRQRLQWDEQQLTAK